MKQKPLKKTLQDSINWNDLRSRDKRGGYFQSRHVVRPFTAEEIESLPEKHEVRKNPELEYKRREIVNLEMPILTQVINSEKTVFLGEKPEVED